MHKIHNNRINKLQIEDVGTTFMQQVIPKMSTGHILSIVLTEYDDITAAHFTD